jgi:hypothetical protein
MSSAQAVQPTEADKPGSPRIDGREPESNAAHPQLNPYSCLACRRKKKKCDRVYPCINCRKDDTNCLFVPRRPSNRPKTAHGVLERLQHLEGVIGLLRDSYSQGVTKQPPEAAKASINTITEQNDTANPCDLIGGGGAQDDAVAELGTELGRLAVGDGRSRYISSSFWASLEEEVCIVRVISINGLT